MLLCSALRITGQLSGLLSSPVVRESYSASAMLIREKHQKLRISWEIGEQSKIGANIIVE
jgi:hypothetical protein